MSGVADTETMRSGRATWRHGTADVSGVASSVLDDVPRVVAALEAALAVAPSSEGTRSHRFEPTGSSLVVATETCRVVAHTWPELGTLTLDVYAADAEPGAIIARCLRELLHGEAEVQVTGSPPLA
jgi:S-adenosylmethionine decarboxylase